MNDSITSASNRVCRAVNTEFRNRPDAILSGYPMQCGALEAILFSVCNALEHSANLQDARKGVLRVLETASKR